MTVAMTAVGEADRRPVTVLFADLSGFTSLSEQLDPEDVRELQTDLLAAMRGALDPLGAFVEKFVGDAVVAVFGAPAAHEDDPERALHAALEMHRRMAGLNVRWAGRVGRPLELHIGVNSGRVVAGKIGTDPDAAYAVTGDVVNTAARLQSAAEAGQTLVSRATFLLTQHAFSFAPAGSVALKGKTEPVSVSRLVGVAERPRHARGGAELRHATPLFGREHELRELLEALERALDGDAQVVSLVGEAGAGKSRLVGELLLELDRRGSELMTVRQATASSLGEPPYGIVAQLCRDAYDVTSEDELPAARLKIQDALRTLGAAAEEAFGMAQLADYVLGLGAPGEREAAEPERLGRQILGMLRVALERRLERTPLLLVVEDLHWADAASVQALSVLVDWLSDRPLLLVLTRRSQRGPDGERPLPVFKRARHTTVPVGPLTAPDAAALLGVLLEGGDATLAEAVRLGLVERAGGNPFFLEEIVRGALSGGSLGRPWTGSAAAPHVAAPEVPLTIEGLLLSRVDGLPPEMRRYLQEASVLGSAFDLGLLRRIGGERADEATLLAMFRSCDLVEERSEREYRFKHALVQEVVYGNLLQRRRAELHGRVARELERQHQARPERLEDLALLGHHFSLSEEPERGGSYLMAAGDWAGRMFANDDAVRHYERALGIFAVRPGREAEALVARERMADLLALTERRGEPQRHYEAVRAAAEVAGDRATQARISRKLGSLHWNAGDREGALACFRVGLELLEGSGEAIELAHLYQEMGRLAFRGGDNAGAVAWAERALEQAERAEAGGAAAAAVAHALNTLGVALARLDRPREAVAHIERSVRVALDEGMLQAACRSYANLGVLYASLDPGRAVATCLTGLEAARKAGDLGFESRLYANLALAYCALTDRCDADGLRAAETAIELDRRLGQLDHLAVPLIVLGQIHECHGHADIALGYYREALVLAEQAGEPQLLFPCYDGLATLALDRGDHGVAEAFLKKAAEVAERAGLDRDSLVILPFLG
jgi:adenylate cyclase